MDGILVIDKPAQWTSHDVVAKARRLTGERQIGHLGTLDPLATGVLPLALGAATRLIEFASHDKEYLASCLLGRTTDSEDVTGKLLGEASVAALEEEGVREKVLGLRRLTEQIPPMVSAIKKDGQKLYELARAGKTVERAPRPIQIREIEVLKISLPRVEFRVACSGGTYVRSLCRELGEQLGVGGCLEKLQRTQSGLFKLKDALTLEELKKSVEEGNLASRLRPVQDLIRQWPSFQPDAQALTRFCRGQALEVAGLAIGWIRVLTPEGRLAGIGQVAEAVDEAGASAAVGRLNPQKVFGVNGIA
jgi:tRNA pseudouridine55 synthase